MNLLVNVQEWNRDPCADPARTVNSYAEWNRGCPCEDDE